MGRYDRFLLSEDAYASRSAGDGRRRPRARRRSGRGAEGRDGSDRQSEARARVTDMKSRSVRTGADVPPPPAIPPAAGMGSDITERRPSSSGGGREGRTRERDGGAGGTISCGGVSRGLELRDEGEFEMPEQIAAIAADVPFPLLSRGDATPRRERDSASFRALPP
ncbi:hypothetical protein THAOC_14434 [Thalassiosira oceanica]|uniref:Uncharacterized protein n=1 Tax=Thalassiosira oceanica TaxID=159749 RepID=K0SHI6_THAOC|nr:hypothetical protein THAOC_14434 [Thalassiosira oceanica]|eukprot:EJK64795.1 hypothetical protein THAOC_14434 [Thalassiosira oceanica]